MKGKIGLAKAREFDILIIATSVAGPLPTRDYPLAAPFLEMLVKRAAG
jgi:hypothetical protein